MNRLGGENKRMKKKFIPGEDIEVVGQHLEERSGPHLAPCSSSSSRTELSLSPCPDAAAAKTWKRVLDSILASQPLGAAACLVGVGLLELGLFTFLPLLR
jgi:hypothetical protein